LGVRPNQSRVDPRGGVNTQRPEPRRGEDERC